MFGIPSFFGKPCMHKNIFLKCVLSHSLGLRSNETFNLHGLDVGHYYFIGKYTRIYIIVVSHDIIFLN